MRNTNICMIALLSLLMAGTTVAYEVAVEFSATAVQKAPGRPDNKKQMYVGKDMVRAESMLNNTLLVEIVKTKEQLRLFLIPGEKIYMQQNSPRPDMPDLSPKPASSNPCEGMKDTSCEMLATEMINDRQAEKWEFTLKQGDQIFLSLHWIDVEHRMLVREFLPDGTLTELSPLGAETINGRHSEKWLWQLAGPGGQVQTATQWYDPELKMTIREEMPGGFVRELRDIKTGSQDKALFEIPDGYKRVENLQGMR